MICIVKLIYYTYTTASYLSQGINYFGESIGSLGQNAYYYVYPKNNLNDIDPLTDDTKYLTYERPPSYILPSAPPMNRVNDTILEYVMVEKKDLLYLINNCNNIELYNKYNNLIY